ncbi:MAG TPA: hypothetical protein VLT15_04380 [Acidimicrobiia bacterium]|nr:hypothetical protein [Acidimicrobiia bacterium]
MKRTPLIALLATVLVFAFAAPATAGGANDNGNGNRTLWVETYSSVGVSYSVPICEGGIVVDHVEAQGPYEWTRTFFGKPDFTRAGLSHVSVWASDDGAYRHVYREKQTVNSIDFGGTGQPNVYNMHGKWTWSDPDGVYLERSTLNQNRWDQDGVSQPTKYIDTGWVCLRDTVLP